MSTTLRKYIEDRGDTRAAALFGVTQRAVAYWRTGKRVPRPDKAREIVALTDGEVTLAGIYGPSRPQDDAA